MAWSHPWHVQVFGNRFSTARSAVNTLAVQRIKLRSDFLAGNTTECPQVHLRSKLFGAIIAKGQAPRETPAGMRDSFRDGAVHRPHCGRTARTEPIIELIAVRILELVRQSEFDPDRLTDATVSTFEG
jgi:hypothetical protein